MFLSILPKQSLCVSGITARDRAFDISSGAYMPHASGVVSAVFKFYFVLCVLPS